MAIIATVSTVHGGNNPSDRWSQGQTQSFDLVGSGLTCMAWRVGTISCAIPNNDDQEQGKIPKFNNMSGWHPIFYTFPMVTLRHWVKFPLVAGPTRIQVFGRQPEARPPWTPINSWLVMAGRHGPSTTPKTVCFPVAQLPENHFLCVTKVLLSLLVLFMFVSYGLSPRHGHFSVSRFACWHDFTKDWQGDLKLCCFSGVSHPIFFCCWCWARKIYLEEGLTGFWRGTGRPDLA